MGGGRIYLRWHHLFTVLIFPPSFSRGVYDTESNIDKRARLSGADEEVVIEDSSLVILYKQDLAKRLLVEVGF